MPIESVGATNPSSWLGTAKVFLLVHPVGVAIVGGVITGVGAYYLVKKFSKKKEQSVAVA
ncbi:MAG: hypothetical protein BWK79_08195 [Beggiatoa sp. IS2]|nr:MAG: hypothetical protein BWK79_08195 [Beggiatoa sp. IS2]